MQVYSLNFSGTDKLVDKSFRLDLLVEIMKLTKKTEAGTKKES